MPPTPGYDPIGTVQQAITDLLSAPSELLRTISASVSAGVITLGSSDLDNALFPINQAVIDTESIE